METTLFTGCVLFGDTSNDVWISFCQPSELWSTSSVDDVQVVIRAVYKQVLGNAHVMDDEHLVIAESQYC